MYQGIVENIDLEIKWSDSWSNRKGHMCVHLYEFMSMHNITKFRKLLKIIRESNTPDEEKKMREWCEQMIEQAEPFKKCATIRKYEKEEQIRQIETEIDLLKYNRDRYKRNNPPYKELSKRLKTKRKNLSEVKAAYRQAVQDIKGAERDKNFMLKCLETMG